MIFKAISTLAVAAGVTIAVPAIAAPTTYSGSDNNATSLANMPNSVAAAAAFNTAAPGLNVITFESATPSGVSISGGGTITNSSCGSICGFNTTVGGANFLYQVGGTATFTFASPVNAFGFYVTGLQSDLVPQQTVTFTDGSSRTINFPTATGGGGAFIGFTDIGASISSVSINVTNDIVAIDDVRYGFVRASAVPEPATWAMMLVGFGAVGYSLRRRSKVATRVRFA